jgi:16S rRNA (uracil1498-N3)-methyltransferase
MTAALFLVEPGALRRESGEVVVIEGAEGRHAATVRRLAVGEPLLVGDGAGGVVDGVVSSVEGKDRVLVVVGSFIQHAPPSPRVVVVQALAKGERGELSVELLTEVGADVVVPWAASRSVAVWRGEKVARGAEKWRSTAREAAKQSRRPFVPVVEPLASTTDVEALLRGAVAAGGAGVVLHEAATLPLVLAHLPPAGDIVLVVGPEGGVTDEELRRFEAAGAVTARLGPSVLRTSTAGAVAVAIVLTSTGRWD